MINCPNKSYPNYKLLVKELGSDLKAFIAWKRNNEVIPSASKARELLGLNEKSIENIQYNDKGEVLAPNGKPSILFKDIEKLVEEQSIGNKATIKINELLEEFSFTYISPIHLPLLFP